MEEDTWSEGESRDEDEILESLDEAADSNDCIHREEEKADACSERSDTPVPPKAKPYGVNRFINWMLEKDMPCDFNSITPGELNVLLEQFYGEVASVVCDKTLSHNTLVCIRYSIHKYLSEPPFNRAFDLIRGEEFAQANVAFKTRFRQLREEPSETSLISADDLIRLAHYFNRWSVDAQILVETCWLYFTYTFRHISHPNWRKMPKDAFQLHVDTSGCLYIGKENAANSGKEERLYGIAVDIFVFYISKLKETRPLFQPPDTMRFSSKGHHSWYRGVSFSQDKFGKMLRNISQSAKLEHVYRKQNLLASDLTVLNDKLMEYQRAEGSDAVLLDVQALHVEQSVSAVAHKNLRVIEVSPTYSPPQRPPDRELSPNLQSREPFKDRTQDLASQAEHLYSPPDFSHVPCFSGQCQESVGLQMKENNPGESFVQASRLGFHSGLPQVLPSIHMQTANTMAKKTAHSMKRTSRTPPDVHDVAKSKVVKDLSFSTPCSAGENTNLSKPAPLRTIGSARLFIPARSSREMAHTEESHPTSPPSSSASHDMQLPTAADLEDFTADVKSEPAMQLLEGYSICEQHMQDEMSNRQLQSMVKSFIPPLTDDLHKGQCGRIGVVGGCKEYTGAPYYAAISALKVGADLSHVFCTTGAASVIKSYSPELIVHPVLDVQGCVEEVSEWLPRLHVLVIGPGLGRETPILNAVKGIMAKAREQNIPMVIDADGVFLVTEDPSVIHGNQNVILTPNAMEFSRLYKAVLGSAAPMEVSAYDVSTLSAQLGNVAIVRKGETDILSHGDNALQCSVSGSSRRCGGQGDLLSGSMGTFLHWAHWKQGKGTASGELAQYGPSLCAGYAACALTRTCNHLAFAQHGRSMTTIDMITHIHEAFTSLFEA